MAMIGLFYALPNTQLTRRLEAEGRLFHQSSKSVGEGDIDQATSGLNFLTTTPRATILGNYTRVIEAIFKPKNYYKRVIYTGLNVNARYKHTPDFQDLAGVHAFLFQGLPESRIFKGNRVFLLENVFYRYTSKPQRH